MNELRKLAEQAMEYLADYTVGESPNASAVNDLIADLEAALAQPEPVEESTLLALARRCLWIAYVWNDHNFVEAAHKYAKEEAEKHGIKSFEQSNDWLRSHPPQRKPLTEDEISEIAMDCSFVSESDTYFARAIEKAHGIE